jgi:hypothetical protein
MIAHPAPTDDAVDAWFTIIVALRQRARKSDRKTEDLVRTLRHDTIPTVTSRQHMQVDVGGTTAFSGFEINSDPNVKHLGLGLAAAVAVDVTVVLMPDRARRNVAARPRGMVATAIARPTRLRPQHRRRTVVQAARQESRAWDTRVVPRTRRVTIASDPAMRPLHPTERPELRSAQRGQFP